MPNDGIHLRSLIANEGVNDENAPLVEDWRRSRTAAYGQTALKKGEGRVEEEIINGKVVKHYN